MRVLHWFPNFLAGGGVANSVSALATAQARAGAEVAIASLANDAPIYGPLTPGEGVSIESWEAGRRIRAGGMRLDLMSAPRRRELAALAPDIVHVHGEFNPDNWWAPRLWGRPMVLAPHGAFHPTVLNRGARRKQAYIAVAQRLLYRHVDRFHALSPAEQHDISAALPAARTFYVAQGPSPAVQRAVEKAAAGQRARPSRQGPVRFVFVGRIDVQTKGLDLLVEAFARAVLSDDAHATLTLVGPDWDGGTAPLRRLARRLGVERLVEFRGRVADVEVAQLLDDADVYVQLSRNESSPLSLNDALFLGLPVIVSDRVGTVSCPEIARLGHVKIVPPAVEEATQAMAQAIAAIVELEQAARSARGELRRFLSWEHAAKRHLDEYASLLAEQRGA
jgi:glycosyltransferase involved in cell wall biosynthesis